MPASAPRRTASSAISSTCAKATSRTCSTSSARSDTSGAGCKADLGRRRGQGAFGREAADVFPQERVEAFAARGQLARAADQPVDVAGNLGIDQPVQRDVALGARLDDEA